MRHILVQIFAVGEGLALEAGKAAGMKFADEAGHQAGDPWRGATEATSDVRDAGAVRRRRPSSGRRNSDRYNDLVDITRRRSPPIAAKCVRRPRQCGGHVRWPHGPAAARSGGAADLLPTRPGRGSGQQQRVSRLPTARRGAADLTSGGLLT